MNHKSYNNTIDVGLSDKNSGSSAIDKMKMEILKGNAGEAQFETLCKM